MISSDTPYKLAEIIRDTWPNLYREPQPKYNIEMPKALPTNEIVNLGGKWDDPIPEGIDPWNLRGRGNKLPEGEGVPFVV